MSSIKTCLILAQQAAMRLRQDRFFKRVTEEEYQAEMPELMAQVDRLRELYADSSGLSAQQSKWMPTLQPLSSRVYSGN